MILLPLIIVGSLYLAWRLRPLKVTAVSQDYLTHFYRREFRKGQID